MLRREFAIADTCFLIDWSRYRRRDTLFKLFRTVFVPEDILREVKSERVITWISEGLRSDQLALYTVSSDEVEEARELIEVSRVSPQLPTIDLPEALCLVIGRRRRYVVLTENRAALLTPKFIDKYRDVVVWRALEVLLNAIMEGIVSIDCSRPDELFNEYSEDTLHIFPSKALKEAVREVEESCRRM